MNRAAKIGALPLIALIRVYQMTLSPFIGRQCRFMPTCSHYAIDALREYGVVTGTALAMKRIARCHPFHSGGYDPVPVREDEARHVHAHRRRGPMLNRPSRRRWLVAAVLIPVCLSLLVHIAMGVALKLSDWVWKPRGVLHAGAGTETALILTEPDSTPPPPPPAPIAASQPEQAPEPEPEPETVRAPELVIPIPAQIPEATTAEPGDAEPPTDPPPTPPKARAPTTFAGLASERADRVVYVVDASGAMASSLAFVVQELTRSIGALDESQYFQVVLFREMPPDSADAGRPPYEAFAPDLVRATPGNKAAVGSWLSAARPVGRSTPLPGLRAALTFKPDVVFLLTRSIVRSGRTREWGSGNDDVLSQLDALNPVNSLTRRRPTIIKAIQFLDEDPSGLLKAIAASHGDGAGSYAVRKIEDLRAK